MHFSSNLNYSEESEFKRSGLELELMVLNLLYLFSFDVAIEAVSIDASLLLSSTV